MKTLNKEELTKLISYLSKQPYAEVFQLMTFLLAPDKKPDEKKMIRADRKRDIDKYCKCNCEPRCCTLKSTDIDIEDCSSILSSCTGENCQQPTSYQLRMIQTNTKFH